MKIRTYKTAAFSLIELLIVIAIIAILASLTVPAVNSLMNSTNLNRAGQQFVDEILVARQIAITRNREVQVRLVQVPDSTQTTSYRAMQIWMTDDSGTNQVPVRRISILPEGIIINSNQSYSPLVFRDSPISGQANFASYGNCSYVGFRFRANGQTDLPPPAGTNFGDSNFLTLQGARENATPPNNFFSILINDQTGRVSIAQPQ